MPRVDRARKLDSSGALHSSGRRNEGYSREVSKALNVFGSPIAEDDARTLAEFGLNAGEVPSGVDGQDGRLRKVLPRVLGQVGSEIGCPNGGENKRSSRGRFRVRGCHAHDRSKSRDGRVISR